MQFAISHEVITVEVNSSPFTFCNCTSHNEHVFIDEMHDAAAHSGVDFTVDLEKEIVKVGLAFPNIGFASFLTEGCFAATDDVGTILYDQGVYKDVEIIFRNVVTVIKEYSRFMVRRARRRIVIVGREFVKIAGMFDDKVRPVLNFDCIVRIWNINHLIVKVRIAFVIRFNCIAGRVIRLLCFISITLATSTENNGYEENKS